MTTRLTYTLDCNDAEALVPFWCEVLGYSLLGNFGQFWLLTSGETVDEPWFVLQQVDELKPGKNRMHVDVHVDDLDGETQRLEGLGAQRVSPDPVLMGDYSWMVLADPEGNEFCLVQPGS